MARTVAACCSAAVLLLAVAIFTSNAFAEPLSGVQTIDRVGDEEKSDLLLSVNQDTGKDQEKTKAGKHREDDAGEVASSTSTEEGKAGSGWAKAKKLDDDEKGDSDSDSDSDSASSSDSDSSGSDSDSNSDDDEHSDGDDSSHGKKEAPRGKHGDLLMKQ
jgi:clumping factor A